MKKPKSVSDAFSVYLSADFTNVMLYVLDTICKADPENSVAIQAEKIKGKILKYGRTYNAKNGDTVSIYFFEKEMVPLLEILIIFLSAFVDPKKDYFPEIGKVKKDRSEHIDPSVEEKIRKGFS